MHAGLIAGALACALVCAAAWTRTRDSVQAAGVVFLLLEGLFRTLPNLLPAGALQAGSYAALLALTAPFLAGSGGLRGLAAACRWGSIGLAALASLALIFIYETHDGAASPSRRLRGGQPALDGGPAAGAPVRAAWPAWSWPPAMRCPSG